MKPIEIAVLGVCVFLLILASWLGTWFLQGGNP